MERREGGGVIEGQLLPSRGELASNQFSIIYVSAVVVGKKKCLFVLVLIFMAGVLILHDTLPTYIEQTSFIDLCSVVV